MCRRWGETKRLLLCLVYPSSGHSAGLIRLKPGTQRFIQVSHKSGRCLSTLPNFRWFSMCIGRGLGWKESIKTSNRWPYGMPVLQVAYEHAVPQHCVQFITFLWKPSQQRNAQTYFGKLCKCQTLVCFFLPTVVVSCAQDSQFSFNTFSHCNLYHYTFITCS